MGKLLRLKQCLLHFLIPFIKRQLHVLYLTTLVRTRDDEGLNATRNTPVLILFAANGWSATQGQPLPVGEKSSLCVRGRDSYTGAGLEKAWPIDHIRLPVR